MISLTHSKILALIFALLTFMLISSGALAQESDAAKKHNITFPVMELGGCNSLTECKQFCEDKANQSACTEFAKKKGIYKSKEQRQQSLIAEAQKALGCSSPESC